PRRTDRRCLCRAGVDAPPRRGTPQAGGGGMGGPTDGNGIPSRRLRYAGGRFGARARAPRAGRAELHPRDPATFRGDPLPAVRGRVPECRGSRGPRADPAERGDPSPPDRASRPASGMKLRRLTLHGFKSFADRTELPFHDGMTAIVGPNGCGKSNISDAVRWVLGEQRASAIRGSKMEEAIFQGTSGRRALNRAEVSLVFSNEDRRLPLPYDEIEIRRTVYREGGSEYELNRTACRLKDIHDLFRDTGLGANAYTVIEQRMVDAGRLDWAEGWRARFDEAAGISRYKDRRQSAQRRRESAEADLSRLEDLMAEVESKGRSLGRQRRRAERYRELRARRLALEMSLATLERESIAAALSRVAARLEALGREEPALRANLSAAEA